MRTRIKFCGFTDERDLHEAAALGVDAVGFVFYPKSPRFVDADVAARLRRSLPSWVTPVGLFVDAQAAEVEQLVSRVGLDVVQFHGDESPELCRAAAGPSRRWWRAVRMRAASDLLESFVRYGEAEALLLDSFSSAYGGSGKGFDWSWIPSRRPLPIVLSGGLNPDNVAAAIAAVKPTMVDVSSGIQSDDPRRKDPARMERFVAEVLRADSKA
ncbi:MAG TPA: phosphoribosylanthranilate isomerase [Burkholderiaceae bacterium]|nr:phosphoribosylanthranilate isomerase [Burkholderiaceae bacterium]